MSKSTIVTFLKSLKIRLMIAFILLGLIPGIILRIGIVKSYETKAIEDRNINISSQAKILANRMVAENYLSNATSAAISAQLEQLANIYDGRIILINQNYRIVHDTYDLDTNKTVLSQEVMSSFQGKEIVQYSAKDKYLLLTIPLTNSQTQSVIGVMLVSVSTDTVQATIEMLNENALIIQVIIAVLLFVISVFAAIHLTKPFAKISKSIAEIQDGYENGVFMVNDYSETEDISIKFNRLTSRMKVLDDSRQEFVSNVSHELKTPLTSMKVLADSLNAQEDVPLELYKEFMLDIGSEIERENTIINDLLSLVKMDKSASDLNITSVNMNAMLEQILKRLQPIADKAKIDLVLESFRPVTADVDEVKITLAISNLIENAIKYNKESGWVHVSLNADHQYFYLKVEDSGIGIPQEALEHIYERFYRVDKSHSREIGGTGLGLAITRSAVLMHRGAIKVFSTEGEGTVFTIRVPLNYIA